MNQTFYILDAAIDRLNITFVRTGNCFSDTKHDCGNHKTGEIFRSPLYAQIRKNRAKQRLLN